MGLTVIIVLILIGLLFLVLELLVFPGQGVAGVIGLAILIVAIWQTYKQFGPMAGHITVGATFLLSIIFIIIALRSNTWKKTMLKDNIEGKVNVIDQTRIKIGDEGVSISRLNPAGKALINDEYYEVRTEGDFVDPDTQVIITKIDSNKIYVKCKT